MAAPTPVTYTQWDGSSGFVYWRAEWATTDNFTDTVLVDISGLSTVGPHSAVNSVKVTKVEAVTNGDIQADLEFDAATDQPIYSFEGQSDVTVVQVMDFRDAPNGARVPTTTAASFVGDILLTTGNVASGDELTLTVWFKRKT